MRGNKGLKFICLVISFICISSILSIGLTLFNYNSNIDDILNNGINKNVFNVNKDFYKSKLFDDDFIRYLVESSSNSVADIDKKDEGLQKNKVYYKKSLSSLKNIDYFIINKDTKEINTNTKYKTAKEFKNNIDGECNIKVVCEDFNFNYEKQIGENKYNIDNRTFNRSYDLETPNCEIYASVHNRFDKGTRENDYLSSLKKEFDRCIKIVDIMNKSIIPAIVLAIISTILYKINKGELFDKESFWLKLSKFIPLELYILGLFLVFVFFVQGFDEGFPYIFITSFLSIGFLLTVIYIFNRQINSYENKMDFFKTTFVYRLFKFANKTFKKGVVLTRKVELSKRIILIAIICIVVNMFVMVLTSDLLLVLILIIITTGGFAYYILKKLLYLSEIMEGTEKIKNGDIHYKLPLVGEDNFTTLADNINNIRDGLDKAIESQLKSERMKSELITNVSHDLKTPLTSIINYVELIKKEGNISPEYLRDYINVLDSKSKRLKVLIEDLFEASKASSGNIELNMEKIDFTQLLRQSVGELEEKLSEANLDLKINVPEEKIYVKADGRRLYRVLENLLSNIYKYSMPNTRVYIDITEADGRVRLTMKNISSYELNFNPEEIMERFKRADDSRNTEGSGLGLAIARDLVNLQGGNFAIDIDGDLFKSIVEFDSIK